MAVRALNTKYIATSRQDITIGLAQADLKDGFLQNMDCDPNWSWKHQEMRCFFIAAGTMVIICFFCAHDLLPFDIKRLSLLFKMTATQKSRVIPMSLES